MSILIKIKCFLVKHVHYAWLEYCTLFFVQEATRFDHFQAERGLSPAPYPNTYTVANYDVNGSIALPPICTGTTLL